MDYNASAFCWFVSGMQRDPGILGLHLCIQLPIQQAFIKGWPCAKHRYVQPLPSGGLWWESRKQTGKTSLADLLQA